MPGRAAGPDRDRAACVGRVRTRRPPPPARAVLSMRMHHLVGLPYLYCYSGRMAPISLDSKSCNFFFPARVCAEFSTFLGNAVCGRACAGLRTGFGSFALLGGQSAPGYLGDGSTGAGASRR